jgi:hypothetical protein
MELRKNRDGWLRFLVNQTNQKKTRRDIHMKILWQGSARRGAICLFGIAFEGGRDPPEA